MIQKELQLERNWHRLMLYIEGIFGKRPADIKSVLFLVGVQELGKGQRKFSKEEKTDLMHIAICKVLSYAGFYTLEGVDEDGWPHWRLIKKLPHFDILEQEKLLKIQILEYFEQELGFQ